MRKIILACWFGGIEFELNYLHSWLFCICWKFEFVDICIREMCDGSGDQGVKIQRITLYNLIMREDQTSNKSWGSDNCTVVNIT